MTDVLNEQKLLDLYTKKTVSVRWTSHTVVLDIPLTGFSSFQLDQGTLKLLKHIEAEHPTWKRAVDLGCGYGTIAINLAITGAATQVVGIDRDALAVAFAQRNAAKNSLTNCQFLGGLDYNQLGTGETFDAILSNVPAKAGEPVHQAMLLDAGQYLNPGGQVAIVVVATLEERIDRILAREQIELRQKVRFPDYVLYLYTFREAVPPAPSPYTRNSLTLSWQDHTYQMETAFGLPEFDSISWDTDLLLNAVAKIRAKLNFRKLIVLNPGQGHIPVILGHLTKGLDEIVLISRDALALRQSAINIRKNEVCETVHSAHTIAFSSPECANATLCVGMINDKEGLEINVEKIAQTRQACGTMPIILASPASFGLRLEKALKQHGIKATLTKKHQGNAVIECM